MASTSPTTVSAAEIRRIHQVGSHLMIRTETPSAYTATIPAHKPLKTGTFAAITSHIAAHTVVTREELPAIFSYRQGRP